MLEQKISCTIQFLNRVFVFIACRNFKRDCYILFTVFLLFFFTVYCIYSYTQYTLQVLYIQIYMYTQPKFSFMGVVKQSLTRDINLPIRRQKEFIYRKKTRSLPPSFLTPMDLRIAYVALSQSEYI
jgi:hypothetical protein